MCKGGNFATLNLAYLQVGSSYRSRHPVYENKGKKRTEYQYETQIIIGNILLW